MATKKKKIYMSLPISGYDISERIETAMKMEVKLKGLGHDVFNPLGAQWESGLSTNEYMRRDLKAMFDCDAVIFMRGFNHSAGCHTELAVAMAIGMDILFEEQINVGL